MAAVTMMKMMERHAVLDALFLEHQSAILDRNFELARDALSRFSAALGAHMAEEEGTILPLYSARAAQPAGGGTQMFLDEHRKMRELLADLVHRVAETGTDAKSILALLDRETLFKGYLDHHDRRERSFLYSGLDAVLSEDERKAILAKLGL